jgi:lipopolysaccharide export system protein LptA
MSPNSLTHSARLMLALILALPGIGNALPEDREQAIQIESNRAIRDEKAGTMIYIGNVELVQGSFKMLADRLEIYTLDNNEVERIIGYGTPAYVEQKPSADKPVIKARGDTIRYFVTEEKLQLEKNASIDQDGSVVTSHIIDYFIKDEIVKASGSEQRVRVVIPPRDENNEP